MMTQQNRPRLVYGRAACSTVSKAGDADHARHVHEARLAQLEQAIPGITQPGCVVMITTIGMNAKGEKIKLARDYRNAGEIVNDPYTWVETPGGVYHVGAMHSDDVKKQLALCGYAFSGKPNMAWMTDGVGNPANRRRGRRHGDYARVRDNED